MISFGQKIIELRKEQKISQVRLAELLHTSKSVIGGYERNERKPSIDVAKRIAKILNTTVTYLLDDDAENDVLKDNEMMDRLKNLNALPENDRTMILFTLDGLIRDAKARMAYR